MSPPRLVGKRRFGQVMIKKKDGQQFVGGSYRVFQGVPVKQVLKSLKKNPQQYLDYYVFEQKSADSNRPERNTIFVFAGDASKYDRAKNDRSPITLMQTNRLGTMMRMHAAKFVGMVDRKWDYPVRIIKAAVRVRKGQRLNSRQKKLQKVFIKRLKKLVAGKKLGIAEIGQAVQKVTKELSDLCATLDNLNIEIVKDPQGKSGAKAISISVRLLSNPASIKIKGVPTAILNKVLAAMGRDMKKLLAKHPAFRSMNIDMSIVGGGGEKQRRPVSPPLKRMNKNGVIAWRYTSGIPLREGKVARAIKGAMAGKGFDLVPELVTGQPMPISQAVFSKVMKRLQKHLEKKPGLYRLNWQIGVDGVLSIVVTNHDRPKVFISQDVVEGVLAQAGVNISAEKKLLDRGTKRWSGKQSADFMKRLKKKFLAKGRELLSDHRLFFYRTKTGSIEIRPYSIKLIKSSRIKIVGDVKLKGIGGVKTLKRILGTKPMTRAQLKKRLLKIEDHYHKAGYLIAGENPGRTNGLQLAVAGKIDGMIRVIVRVVRMGKVEVIGNIPRKSKAALRKAIQGPSGKPFRPRDLIRNISRATIRLVLPLKSEPVFIMRPNGMMDVVVGIKRPMARFNLGAGTDGRYFIAALGGTFHHLIPGTSYISATANAGKDNYGASIQVKSLPLNADGVHLMASLSYMYSYYWYRKRVDHVEESGMFHKGSGSLTVHIPLGGQGIASPFDLFVGARGSIVHRKGQKANGDSVRGISYYVGNVVGISSLHTSVIAKGDRLQANASVGLDHSLTTKSGDVTLSASLSYAIPLGKYFALQASARGAIRLPAYGGKLAAERYFGEWNIPLIDFGRSMGDPYSADHFWHSSLFIILTHSRYFQPMVGATISGNGSGGVQGGAGVAIRVPIIGLTFYLGSDHKGRATWGISAGGSREL